MIKLPNHVCHLDKVVFQSTLKWGEELQGSQIQLYSNHKGQGN